MHDGFQSTFERTANDILGAVSRGLTDNNVGYIYIDGLFMILMNCQNQSTSVLVAGHSLGAILSVMTSVFLKQQLGSQIKTLTPVVFGLPRGGNKAFSDFVNSNVSLSY